MSADNWGVCPKCNLIAEIKAKEAYGKVSEEEYLRLIQNEKNAGDKQTLREDYEIGMDSGGEFSISYSCHCSVCSFKFKHSYLQSVEF